VCIQDLFPRFSTTKKELFMANVWATKMATGYHLKPGAKAYWTWNNAPTDTVYSFSVRPILVTVLPDSADLSASAAVTNVNYQVRKNSYDSPKGEVNIEIANTGSSTIHYALYMSQIGI
jgi:hypothetical protein